MVEELRLPQLAVDRVVELKSGYGAYKTMFGGDLDWMGVLGPAGQAYLRLIEAAVFKFNLDEAVHKLHMNAGRTESELLDKEPFKES